MKFTYKNTLYSCFAGYVVLSIVNSFMPLLFVMFQENYGIPLTQITLLITINFLIQLSIDIASALFVDKIGYRASMLIAHTFAALGLGLLTVLPDMFENAFIGILISVVMYAVGGGLLEVLVSPVAEACPTENKETTMSLLHSFYSWGCVLVILGSAGFFAIAGIENWRYLTLLWMLVPICNGLLFLKVPIYSLHEEGETGMTISELIKEKTFWILMVMMLCAGASEHGVSQWASAFAEQGLGISKTLGDLLGPMSFAIFMGISRVIYGKYGDKMDLDRFMRFSALLCVISYLCIAVVPIPIVELIGCGMAGFAVGIMWPGTFSKASAIMRRGGTVMFALLALAGDLGCSSGPTLAGFVSSAFGNNLKYGMLSAIVFPAVLLIILYVFKRQFRIDTAENKNV